ncbi:NAD(P)/FAD-dependent oxidoreductase [Halorientalis pallida]|uniref:FAD-dependent oxidoreductase n=1 Tax=Halorientalis pallida TaxID=2479928 RepID=A0A498KUW3_9EURY|nr:NAD(P)/FAD-dependent oxidoreductase [Halorientalis pallida]RXK46251.1 FAD-dependent oxidoreductase [Halorientalis pallida]
MTDAVVVGGGLAGLVAARHLADAGRDVTVLERRDEVGGRVRSVREDGFVFDRGFQVLFTAYPAAKRELDYDALDLRYFSAGATIANPGRRSVLADPLSSPGDLSDTLFNTDVTLGDKLRLFKLQREMKAADIGTLFDPDERQDVRDYLSDRGFSEKFVENFAAPFYGGITLDRSLSTDAGVFRYTFKMLSEGKTAVPAEGMGAISEQLADRARTAGAEIELGTAVTALDAADDGVTVETDGETISADGAVVATDPPTAAALTDVAVPTETSGCVTQYYGLPGHVELETGKKIVLNARDAEPNQIAPLSAVASEYAPDDRTLVSATWLGERTESDEQLHARGREVLGQWYPERQFEDLELLRTDRIDVAQFTQPPGFRADLPAVDAPDGPVVLAGDYTRWSAIQGALESGRVAARTLE